MLMAKTPKSTIQMQCTTRKTQPSAVVRNFANEIIGVGYNNYTKIGASTSNSRRYSLGHLMLTRWRRHNRCALCSVHWRPVPPQRTWTSSVTGDWLVRQRCRADRTTATTTWWTEIIPQFTSDRRVKNDVQKSIQSRRRSVDPRYSEVNCVRYHQTPCPQSYSQVHRGIRQVVRSTHDEQVLGRAHAGTKDGPRTKWAEDIAWHGADLATYDQEHLGVGGSNDHRWHYELKNSESVR